MTTYQVILGPADGSLWHAPANARDSIRFVGVRDTGVIGIVGPNWPGTIYVYEWLNHEWLLTYVQPSRKGACEHEQR